MPQFNAAFHSRYYKDDVYYRELKWNGCEDILLQAVADKLFIFDCCYAASAISTGFRGASETICASGFDSIAPRPGPHSFTTALIFVLRQMAQYPRPFSVSVLCSAVLTYLKALDPTQIALDGVRIANAQDHILTLPGLRRPEYRRTPVHFVRANHHHQSPNIQLFPLVKKRNFEVIHEERDKEERRARFPTFTLKIRPTHDLTEADADATRRWLRSIPIVTESISIDAALSTTNAWGGDRKSPAPGTFPPGYSLTQAAYDLKRSREVVEEITVIAAKNDKATQSIHTTIFFLQVVLLPATLLNSLAILYNAVFSVGSAVWAIARNVGHAA